jgi:hypothetical protein
MSCLVVIFNIDLTGSQDLQLDSTTEWQFGMELE